MSCGKCPVSLTCYAGQITCMYLCPLCNNLIVTNEEKVYVKCGKRCCKDFYVRWWLRFIQMRVCSENTLMDLCTCTTEKDPGPHQNTYTRKDLISVRLCNSCINVWSAKSRRKRITLAKSRLDELW